MSIKGNTESSQSAPEAPKRMSVEASDVFEHSVRPANYRSALQLRQIVEGMYPLPQPVASYEPYPPADHHLNSVLDNLEFLQQQARQELQDA